MNWWRYNDRPRLELKIKSSSGLVGRHRRYDDRLHGMLRLTRTVDWKARHREYGDRQEESIGRTRRQTTRVVLTDLARVGGKIGSQTSSL